MVSREKIVKIDLVVPSTILPLKGLTPNSKLIYGLHHALSMKKGYLRYTNEQIAEHFGIHPTIVSKSQKQLVNMGFITKDKSEYRITSKYRRVKSPIKDDRDILIPFEIYSERLNTGAKLLWGEYNTRNKDGEKYFMKRSNTAIRLGVSMQSITNWTQELERANFLECEHRYGRNTTQRVIETCRFERYPRPMEYPDYEDDEY